MEHVSDGLLNNSVDQHPATPEQDIQQVTRAKIYKMLKRIRVMLALKYRPAESECCLKI